MLARGTGNLADIYQNGHSWSKDLSNATGNVDVIGVDSYPTCWTCNVSECASTNGEYIPYVSNTYRSVFLWGFMLIYPRKL